MERKPIAVFKKKIIPYSPPFYVHFREKIINVKHFLKWPILKIKKKKKLYFQMRVSADVIWFVWLFFKQLKNA